jgi:outer membrane protein TolC
VLVVLNASFSSLSAHVLMRWPKPGLAFCLILFSGCSRHSALRSSVDQDFHRPTVIRAQNAVLGSGDTNRGSSRPIEPAVWRSEREAASGTHPVQLARYGNSGQNYAPFTTMPNATKPVAESAVANSGYDVGNPLRPGTPLPANLPTRDSQSVPMPTTGEQGKNSPPTSPVPQFFLPLTLRDAIESALSDSSVVRTLEGRVNVAQITPADVEIADWNVIAQQGQFQPRLSGNFDATKVNQPPNAFFGPGISADTQRDVVDAGVSVNQPLKTGGLVSVGIEPATAYLFFPDGVSPGQFNPLYSTDYVIRVTQPILRGAGSKVALAPIRIAQIQSNAVRHELDEVLNSQIRSLTETYWRLYAAHLQVQSIRSVIPLAEESVRVEKLRLSADRSILADVARAQVQLDGFRRTEATMQGTLRKRVLQLRQLMGGQPMIEPLLLPAEAPQETPPPGDASALIQTAMQTRPALNVLRERLSEKYQILGLAQNAVLPSVDVRGEYRMNGLDERLDDAFHQAATNNYTDMTLGVAVNVPIGNKTARSRRRIAELDVARDQMRLAALEQNVAFEVTDLVSDLEAAWQRMQIARRQTQETQEWLRVSRIRYTQPPAARTSQDWLLLALTDLQSAMRSYVDAMSDLSESVADYNTLLAELQQAQGMSVYEWRQTSSGVSGEIRGHAGTGYSDYRSNPASVRQASPQPGHAFLNPISVASPAR